MKEAETESQVIMKDRFCFLASTFHQVGIEHPFCVILLDPFPDIAGSLVGINRKSKVEGGEKEGKKNLLPFMCRVERLGYASPGVGVIRCIS